MSVADSTAAVAKKPAGLEGVPAFQSRLCFIDGKAGRLVYCGYEINDLVEHTSFEEVAFLLWEDRLPNRSELRSLKQRLGESAALPSHVLTLLRTLPPSTPPMDALRTAVSALGATDPDVESNEPDADRRKAIRITAQLPT